MSCRRPALMLLLAVALAAVGSACQVDTEVAVDVEPDGSGAVRVAVILDADAAGQLGDPATALRLDDLSASGWDVEDPASLDDGGVELVARRPFDSPERLSEILDQVGGGGTGDVPGVFASTRLVVDDGFASTTYRFSSDVSVTGDPQQFSDPELTAALGGLALGRDLEELVEAGVADPETATLELLVRLPGGTPDTNGEVGSGGASSWSVPLTGGEPTSLTATSESSLDEAGTTTLIGLGAFALVGAVVLVLVGLSRRAG